MQQQKLLQLVLWHGVEVALLLTMTQVALLFAIPTVGTRRRRRLCHLDHICLARLLHARRRPHCAAWRAQSTLAPQCTAEPLRPPAHGRGGAAGGKQSFLAAWIIGPCCRLPRAARCCAGCATASTPAHHHHHEPVDSPSTQAHQSRTRT